MIVREPLKTNLQALFGQMEVNAKVCCCLARGVSSSLISDIAHQVRLWQEQLPARWHSLLVGGSGQFELRLRHQASAGCAHEQRGTEVEVRKDEGDLTHRVSANNRWYLACAGQGIPSRTTAIESNRKTMQVQLVDQNAQGGIKPSTTG